MLCSYDDLCYIICTVLRGRYCVIQHLCGNTNKPLLFLLCYYCYYRLSWLQNSEKRWQSRVPLRESNNSARVSPSSSASRPTSIADRLSQLNVAQQSWTTKVGHDNDAKKFTTDDKLGRRLNSTVTDNIHYFSHYVII